MNVCSTCKLEKERSEFHVRKSAVNGLQRHCKQCIHEYYVKHKIKLNRNSTRYQKERRRTDPAYLLVTRLRVRLGQALDGRGKDAPTMKLLGCTADQFREHIESQFVDGMGWNQRGKWHLEHRLPIAAFDMTKPKHQRYAMHWSNCQPMFAEDNLRKSDKYCPKELKKFLASTLMEYSLKKKDEKR